MPEPLVGANQARIAYLIHFDLFPLGEVTDERGVLLERAVLPELSVAVLVTDSAILEGPDRVLLVEIIGLLLIPKVEVGGVGEVRGHIGELGGGKGRGVVVQAGCEEGQEGCDEGDDACLHV